MAIPKTVDDLTDALVKLGFNGDHARLLAEEQLRSGIPHVENASFIKIVRSFMTSHDDDEKIQTASAPTPAMLQHNTLIRLRHELLGCDVSGDLILRFERAIQRELLNDIFCFLSGHYSNDSIPVDTFHICSIDDSTNEVTAHLTALNELIWDLDK